MIRVPGKVVNGRRYFHRSTLDLQPAKVQVAVHRAVAAAPAWQWEIARVTSNLEQVALIQSPNWNTAPEPDMGPFVLVRMSNLSVSKVYDMPGSIYHHKWMFVADDYVGFDVAESKARSAVWESLNPPVDRSRIGRKSYWITCVIPRLT